MTKETFLQGAEMSFSFSELKKSILEGITGYGKGISQADRHMPKMEAPYVCVEPWVSLPGDEYKETVFEIGRAHV